MHVCPDCLNALWLAVSSAIPMLGVLTPRIQAWLQQRRQKRACEKSCCNHTHGARATVEAKEAP